MKALQDISFDLKEGEVHCLCGENGAGKSTLIKILSGAYQPDEGGEIIFDGKKVTLNPHLAMALGIQTIYQEHIVFDNLSIIENIFTGSEIAHGGILNKAEMRKQTVDVLQYLKSDLDPDTKMKELSSGEQKTVEIAKGLVFKRRVIILDEPTASFSSSEIDNLLEIIRTVKTSGLGIIYISHHLEEVFKIGDRITVLRDGRKVSMHDFNGLTKTQLIKDMVGRDPSTFYQREQVPIGEVIFEARNVSGERRQRAFPSSFAGARSSAIAGHGRLGPLRADERPVRQRAPRQRGDPHQREAGQARPARRRSIRNRMCFITEDRQNTGLFLPQTIAQNVAVANLVNVRSSSCCPRTTCGSGTIRQDAEHQDHRFPDTRHEPVRRQPAEGRPGQVVQHQRRDIHIRRAHARHRRRVQAGDLPGHGGPAEAGQGHHHGLLRHARDHLHERQGPHHEKRGKDGRACQGTRSPRRTS